MKVGLKKEGEREGKEGVKKQGKVKASKGRKGKNRKGRVGQGRKGQGRARVDGQGRVGQTGRAGLIENYENTRLRFCRIGRGRWVGGRREMGGCVRA